MNQGDERDTAVEDDAGGDAVTEEMPTTDVGEHRGQRRKRLSAIRLTVGATTAAAFLAGIALISDRPEEGAAAPAATESQQALDVDELPDGDVLSEGGDLQESTPAPMSSAPS